MRSPATGRRGDLAIDLGREIGLTVAAIAATSFAAVMFIATMFGDTVRSVVGGAGVRLAIDALFFGALVALLIYGNLIYQCSRLGYLLRSRQHHRARRDVLEALFDVAAPAVLFLIPSYREDPRVVRQTLLSAALQEYPNREVVLLIDDDPAPGSDAARRGLQAARELPAEIERSLRPLATVTRQALERFERRRSSRPFAADGPDERRALADLEIRVANALERFATLTEIIDHTDALFVEQILRAPARAHRQRARDLLSAAAVSDEELRRGYRRLAARFSVRVSSFERKRYVNLSHEPNKAMNLNSYLGLIGSSWRMVDGPDGTHLDRADEGPRDLDVPDVPYVVTLDADSLILPDYALRLIHILERPENARVAIVQTPYSAIPGAGREIELMAGATTDLQYIVHQGFTRFRATFWVGANAVIRRQALADIRTIESERGHVVSRFIQDRTVIEDTESSIDLADKGWSLLNYPERLSYSATPPDFGALLIQRRRWANGGLIILPKLVRSVRRRRSEMDAGMAETIVRAHYLTSIAGANVALLAILLYPFPDSVVSMWLPLTAVPYYLLYARDLAQAGYRMTDVLRIYALNLLLLPVNIGGLAKSLQQAWTRRKIPFGRTPKVLDRTAAPAAYLLAEVALLTFFGIAALSDLATGELINAAFAATNVWLLSYAVGRYVGWRDLASDVWVQIAPRPLRLLSGAVARAVRPSIPERLEGARSP